MARIDSERVTILYRTRPAWKIGAGTDEEIPDSHHEDDFSGKIISIVPPSHIWNPGDLVDPARRLVTLDQSGLDLERLREQKLKITGEGIYARLEEVTFDDRWGEVGKRLKERFGSIVEDLEREAEELSGDPETAEAAIDHPFEIELRRVRRALPKMVTHTGVGLYEVGPGKTYSTIQSALDQLWTDQGSAIFTANQYIRTFADTYAENVAPNASLNPDEINGCTLIIEGDPADDRANIVVSPVGGTYTFFVNCDQCMLRHLKIAGTPTAQIVRTSTGCARLEVLDCEITGAKTGIYSLYYARVEDCSITVTVNAIAVRIGSSNYGGLISGCVIVGPGKATSTSYGIYNAGRYIGLTVEATVISGFRYGVYLVENSGIHVANCTLYDCTYGIHPHEGLDPFVWIRNTIFSVVDYPFYFITWPEESATALGPTVVQRNNVFHSYTAIGYNGSGTKTFAQWVVLGQVDANGDLDATDPKLVDPASGDFSLAADSPCRHAGHGSGVVEDYLGTAFDAHHPDVGAWSTGTISAPARPLSYIVSIDGAVITMNVYGERDAEHTAELIQVQTRQLVDSDSRSGDGPVTLTAPKTSAQYFIVISSRNAGGRSVPSIPCVIFT